MTTHPNPAGASTRAARIEQIESLLDAAYAALHAKAGRGSVTAGDVTVAYSSLSELQRLINRYELRLNRLRNPSKMAIVCR